LEATATKLLVDGALYSTLDITSFPATRVKSIELGLLAGSVVESYDIAYDDVSIANVK
jgi:hypothetical protein